MDSDQVPTMLGTAGCLATVWCFMILALRGDSSSSTVPELLLMTCRGRAGEPPYTWGWGVR